MSLDSLLAKYKSTGTLGPKKLLLWKCVRSFLPARERIFFEGEPRIPGQLWYRERVLIHEMIAKTRPRYCFEIGTWRGGGSTYYITRALAEYNCGHLHTIEADAELYRQTTSDYARFLPKLAPYVTFHLGDYRKEYVRILKECGGIDFVLLDGPEDAQETIRQYEFFLPFMKVGTVLLAHDWLSEKSRLLRPLIEHDDRWAIQTVLGQPESLGLVAAVRK